MNKQSIKANLHKPYLQQFFEISSLITNSEFDILGSARREKRIYSSKNLSDMCATTKELNPKWQLF